MALFSLSFGHRRGRPPSDDPVVAAAATAAEEPKDTRFLSVNWNQSTRNHPSRASSRSVSPRTAASANSRAPSQTNDSGVRDAISQRSRSSISGCSSSSRTSSTTTNSSVSSASTASGRSSSSRPAGAACLRAATEAEKRSASRIMRGVPIAERCNLRSLGDKTGGIWWAVPFATPDGQTCKFTVPNDLWLAIQKQGAVAFILDDARSSSFTGACYPCKLPAGFKPPDAWYSQTSGSAFYTSQVSAEAARRASSTSSTLSSLSASSYETRAGRSNSASSASSSSSSSNPRSMAARSAALRLQEVEVNSDSNAVHAVPMLDQCRPHSVSTEGNFFMITFALPNGKGFVYRNFVASQAVLNKLKKYKKPTLMLRLDGQKKLTGEFWMR